MEQTFVACIQQTVKGLAEKYEFDYEEALAEIGLDDLKVTTTMGKTKGIVTIGDAPKRTNPKFPLPFTGEVFDDCCRAIVFNGGLFTQCLKVPKPESQNSLCKTCEKQAEKTPNGVPSLGLISDRVERGEDWTDPKGRRPVPYTKVMKAKKFTREEVIDEVSQFGMNIDLTIFDEPETEKRGRKKGKKTEVQSIFEDDDEGMLGSLIQEVKGGSETSEASKTSKTSSKKSKEEREAEKQEKASQKSENDMMKSEEKRMKAWKKEEENAAKEHEKKAKELQKEALKAMKEAREEEKRIAKEAKDAAKAVKDAAKAAKDAAKAMKEANEKRQPLKDIQEWKTVEPVSSSLEEDSQMDPPPLSPMGPPEDDSDYPMGPPPEEEFEVVEEPAVEEEFEVVEEPAVEEVEEPVVEEVEEPVVAAKKPKMKKFKGPDGVSYIADDKNVVYRKDAPTVRVGELVDGCLALDEEDDEEEEEEELSEDEA